MAETTKSIELNRAFVLEEAAIRKIWELVYRNSEKPQIEFRCSDNSEIKTEDLQDLLEFSNSSMRRIVSVEFTNSYNSPLRIGVKFSGVFGYKSTPEISYRLVGLDRDVIHTSYELDQLIRNCTRWYSAIIGSQYLPSTMDAGISALATVFLAIYVRTIYPDAIKETQALSGLITVLLMVSFGISWILWKAIVLPIYPKAIFDIGTGIRRYNSRKRAVTIAISLLVALILSVLANWLWSKFS